MKRKQAMLVMIVILSIGTLVAAPLIGIERISLSGIMSGLDPVQHDIFWKIRVPRVLAACIAGAVLAVSGMSFQALFRNPLASPFTLGVSSGAAFGAALYLKLGLGFTLLGLSGSALFAFAGALLSVAVVYGLARSARGFSTATMLLAGIAVNFFFSGIILFIQYISDFTDSFRIIRWLMGGLEIAGFKPIFAMLPFAVAGCGGIFLLSRELNLMLLGEDIAAGRGVSTAWLKAVLLIGVSLMVGSVVAVTGPIGFVGIMCPHICRLMLGYDHRFLAPACILFGGAFLVVCDTAARVVIAPAEMPVGVITALLGGPFFLWLLLRGASERGVMG